MPALNRAPNEREQERLRKIFLTAETAIIHEIGRLRSMGQADYQQICTAESEQMETVAREIAAVADNFFYQTMDAGSVAHKEQIF